MARCPHCEQTHLEGTDYCPRTGKPLVDVATRMIGRTIAGKYRLVSCLGQGGMGTIFQAEHTVIGNSVAVKLLHEPFAASREPVQRLYREARATGAIGHPNIINIFDVGETSEGTPFLVMELLEGESLGEHLERNGPRPLGFVLEVGIQMLSALKEAHRTGIIHRDLKSDNVFLIPAEDKSGVRIKLLDFGVSKFLTPDGDGLNLTQTGSILGTPYYMSPEQASGKKDLDHRLDIYAAGIILYECLTGSVPHKASNYNALLMEIITQDVKSFRWQRPDVPRKMEMAIVKALAREKEHRWIDAADFMAVLEEVRADLTAEQLGGNVRVDLVSSRNNSRSSGRGASTPSLTDNRASDDDRRESSIPPSNVPASYLSESGSFVFRNGKRFMWTGGLLVVIVLVIIVLMSYSRAREDVRARYLESPREGEKAEAVPVSSVDSNLAVVVEADKEKQEKEELVQLNIRCRPSIAALFIDGKPVSKGVVQVPASDEVLDVVAHAEGYETKRMGIVPLRNMDVEISLTPLVPSRKGRPALQNAERAVRRNAPETAANAAEGTRSQKDESSGGQNAALAPPPPQNAAQGSKSGADTSPRSLDRPMENPF